VIVDIGTGDGRAVLLQAAAEPTALVVGVDAAASAMADPSRRADRRGPANVLFLAAGAETLAVSPLAGRADLVTVRFPWGSLLRGIVGLDDPALCGVASLVAEGGRLEVLASVVPSDGVAGMSCLDVEAEPAIRRAWCAAGLRLTAMRPVSAAEIAASGSTWARRLRAGEDARSVWRLEGTRSASIDG
jgi:16S rRNA (adenine(1408)-N(1))-methyltransferase